jgi:putative transposase
MSIENEAKKEYRTYQMEIKKGNKLYRYFDQICTNGNKLYNITNFYIRQVYTALNQDKNWQPIQREVMDHIQNNLQKMNENQTKSYYKRLEKEKLKSMDQQKETKLNLFDFPTKEKSFLGYNFLDCLFKTMKQKDYYSLPGQINQQVLKNVVQNWKSFFESLKDYKMHPEKYSGRPSIPGYLPKGVRKKRFFLIKYVPSKRENILGFQKQTLN